MEEQSIKKVTPPEPTNREILETLEDFMGMVNGYAIKTESDIAELKIMASKNTSDITDIKDRLGSVENQLDRVKGQLATRVVTKDYLDDKLFDLRGDFVALANILETKNIITRADKQRLYTVPPLAKA